jgi:hypothetical protein
LNSIDLRADSMTAYGRDFGPTRFTLGHAADGLDMGFNRPAVEARCTFRRRTCARHGVTAQFARLYWPEQNDADSERWQRGEWRESRLGAAAAHSHRRFPPGRQDFGESVVETYPIAGGSHFEQVSTHSSNIEMRAHGDWTGRPGRRYVDVLDRDDGA